MYICTNCHLPCEPKVKAKRRWKGRKRLGRSSCCNKRWRLVEV